MIVVLGIVVSVTVALPDHGVAVVGHIPSGQPTITWPALGIDNILDLLPAALGIFAVGFADGIAARGGDI